MIIKDILINYIEKTCTNPECDRIFPATTEYFNRVALNKDGLSNQCKICVRAYNKEYARKRRAGLPTSSRGFKNRNVIVAEPIKSINEKYKIWREEKIGMETEIKKYNLKLSILITDYEIHCSRMSIIYGGRGIERTLDGVKV